MSGADDFAAAVMSHVERRGRDAEAVVQEGVVSRTTPDIVIRLIESSIELQDDEFVLSQAVKKYHTVSVIDPGDNVLLMRKRTSGEIRWVVYDVLSDKAPL